VGRACTWCAWSILLQQFYIALTDHKVSTVKLSGSIVCCFNNADTKFRHLTRFRASSIHLAPPSQLSNSSSSVEFLSNFVGMRVSCVPDPNHIQAGSVGTFNYRNNMKQYFRRAVLVLWSPDVRISQYFRASSYNITFCLVFEA
jgi:hypothetical protein